VLVNPTSGGGAALCALPGIEDLLHRRGFPADFRHTSSAADMRERAASAAAEGYACVAALGGDGAFHYAMSGAFGTGVAIACIPAGSGNDIAMGLGIPLDPIDAAHLLVSGTPRPVDLLRLRFSGSVTQLMIGAGGMGLDAEANQLATSRFRRVPGLLKYVTAALAALATSRPIGITAEIDGKVWSGRLLLAAVANSPTYGAGFKIAPAASMNDGWMDLTFVEDLPWQRIFEAILILLRTGDLRWPQIHRFRARRVRLSADRRSPFHGDGEILGEAPLEIEVLPAAIRVIAPAFGVDATGQAGNSIRLADWK
jgi:diacylglycerol kinase (ATP)